MRTLILLLLGAGVAAAQPPRGFFPWWDSPIVSELNLTEEQRKQVQETVQQFRTKLIDQRAAVAKAEDDAEEIFNDDNVDPKKANEAIERLIAARSDLTRTFVQMSLRLRLILTPEQWKELRRRRPVTRPGSEPPQPPGGVPSGPHGNSGA